MAAALVRRRRDESIVMGGGLRSGVRFARGSGVVGVMFRGDLR
jgi:hypothetical protein